MAGEHNQHNAAAAVVCATELGMSREQIQRGLSTFTGIKRRMEVRGEAAGVTVLDDFAHHPTAIAETIRAIREKYPRRRLWALFEPRSNTTRRNVFQQELTESLALADGVFISRVDRLQELGENERLNPEAIIKQLRSQGRVAEYSPNADEIVNRLVPNLHEHDVVASLFQWAIRIGIHDKLLERLGSRGETRLRCEGSAGKRLRFTSVLPPQRSATREARTRSGFVAGNNTDEWFRFLTVGLPLKPAMMTWRSSRGSFSN